MIDFRGVGIDVNWRRAAPHKAVDSRQSAVADGPKRFVDQLPCSIEIQIPLPPMADDLRGQRIQTPAHRDHPSAFPDSRQQS